MRKAAKNYTSNATALMSDAQEILRHIPRGLERDTLNPNLKGEVADALVEAIVELREGSTSSPGKTACAGTIRSAGCPKTQGASRATRKPRCRMPDGPLPWAETKPLRVRVVTPHADSCYFGRVSHDTEAAWDWERATFELFNVHGAHHKHPTTTWAVVRCKALDCSGEVRVELKGLQLATEQAVRRAEARRESGGCPDCSRTDRHAHCRECGATDHRAANCDMLG